MPKRKKKRTYTGSPRAGRREPGLKEAEDAVMQDIFLKEFAEIGIVKRALKVAGATRKQLLRWKEDPEFMKRFEDAKEDAIEELEAEALRRAKDGEKRIKYSKDGEVLEEYYEKSDLLTIFLLKGMRPEKYRDRVHVEGKVGGAVAHLHLHKHRIDFDAQGVTDDQLAQLAETLPRLLAGPEQAHAGGNGRVVEQEPPPVHP